MTVWDEILRQSDLLTPETWEIVLKMLMPRRCNGEGRFGLLCRAVMGWLDKIPRAVEKHHHRSGGLLILC